MSSGEYTRCDGCRKSVLDETPEGWLHIVLTEDYPIEIIGKTTSKGSYDYTIIADEDLHFCSEDCFGLWMSREVNKALKETKGGRS
jgi:hypothetical protein